MSDRTVNPYLPLAFEATGQDPGPWRVASFGQFALRGILVAVFFAPFWKGYALCMEFAIGRGQLLGVTSPGLILKILGAVIASASFGAISMTCASLIPHHKTWLHFFVAGAGIRSGTTLLQGVLAQRVRSASAELLLVQTLDNVVPMCLLIIIFVRLANRRLPWTSFFQLMIAVIVSVVATELVMENFMWSHFRSSTSFRYATIRDSVLLVVLAFFFWMVCMMSRSGKAAMNVESSK